MSYKDGKWYKYRPYENTYLKYHSENSMYLGFWTGTLCDNLSGFGTSPENYEEVTSANKVDWLEWSVLKEINIDVIGCHYSDFTTSKRKELSNYTKKKVKEELMAKAKHDYPIGTQFKAVVSGQKWIVEKDQKECRFIYSFKSSGSIYVTAKNSKTGYYNDTCIYQAGKEKWAIIILKKVQIKNKPEPAIPEPDFGFGSSANAQIVIIGDKNAHSSIPRKSVLISPNMLAKIQNSDGRKTYWVQIREVRDEVLIANTWLTENHLENSVSATNSHQPTGEEFMHIEAIRSFEPIEDRNREHWMHYCVHVQAMSFEQFCREILTMKVAVMGGRRSGKTASSNEWMERQERNMVRGARLGYPGHAIVNPDTIFVDPQSQVKPVAVKDAFPKEQIEAQIQELETDTNGIEDISCLHIEDEEIVPDMNDISVESIDLNL